jgi:hypothetical protein
MGIVPDYLSVAGLLDRVVVLEVKYQRLRLAEARRVTGVERQHLGGVLDAIGVETVGSSWLGSSWELRRLHSRLWDLESEIRLAEVRESFGEEFLAAASEIQRLNRDRRYLRIEVAADMGIDQPDELIEIQTGMESHADRAAIRLSGRSVALEIDHDPWARAMRLHGLEPITTVAGFEMLSLVHHRMSAVWNHLDTVGGNFEDPALVPSYRAIYILNDSRSRIRASILASYPAAYWDVKEYPVYPQPPGWDHRTCWWITHPEPP